MYRYPFTPYPNGWYRVALGSEVKRGRIVNLQVFGRELIAYRGDDGVAHVLDAHCPHLGAHLGHGGKVVGNAVECPMQAIGQAEIVDLKHRRPPRRRSASATSSCPRATAARHPPGWRSGSPIR